MRSNYARPETLIFHHASYRLSTVAASQVMIRLDNERNSARIVGSPRSCRLEVRGAKHPVATMTGHGLLSARFVIADERSTLLGIIYRSDTILVGSRFSISLPDSGGMGTLVHRDLGLKGFRKKLRQRVRRNLELIQDGDSILSIIDHHTMLTRGCLVQFHDKEGPALDRKLGLFLAYLVLLTPNILSFESVEHLDV